MNIPNVNIAKSTEIPNGRYSPRVPSNSHNINQQPFINNLGLGSANTTVRLSRPSSPRVSQPTNPSHQPFMPSSVNSYTIPNPVVLPTTSLINSTTYTSNQPISSYSSPYYYQQTNFHPSQFQPQPISTSYSTLLPLKTSNIDSIRPSKNIFPNDTYMNKTKFD